MSFTDLDRPTKLSRAIDAAIKAENDRAIEDGIVLDVPLVITKTPEEIAEYTAKVRAALAEPGAWDFLN